MPHKTAQPERIAQINPPAFVNWILIIKKVAPLGGDERPAGALARPAIRARCAVPDCIDEGPVDQGRKG